jgi:hypothetical protein
MPHLSRRVDKRVEMGHRPEGDETLSDRDANSGGTWEPRSQKIFGSAENFIESFTNSHRKSQ